MLPNYIVISANSPDELQKKINDAAKDGAKYKPINVSAGPSGSNNPYLALMEATFKS